MDRRRNDTKKKIIAITRRNIEETGFSMLSIRAVMTELGISCAGLYNHFKNKDELLDTILEMISSDVFKSYKARYASVLTGVDSAEQLALLAEYLLGEFNSHRHRMDFLMFSPNALTAFSKMETHHDRGHQVLNEVYRLVSNMKAEYGLSSDVNTLYTKCWSFFHGYALLISSDIVPYEKDLIRETIDDIITGDQIRASN